MMGFNRNINEAEMGALIANHDKWRVDLPKVERPEILQIFLGNPGSSGPPPPPPMSTAPIIFQSFRRDGNLEWQMQANANWLAVNCLSYSRWDAISKQAIGLLKKAFQSFDVSGLFINSVSLQYIDTFIWTGEFADYDIAQLLKTDSDILPSNFSSGGPAWYFHKGHFELNRSASIDSRLQNRIHIDSQIENNQPVSRVDVTLSSDRIASNNIIPFHLDDIESEFQTLHVKNKNLLADIINLEMQARIALNGDQHVTIS